MSAVIPLPPQRVWEKLSPDQRDGAYNNTAAVANSAAWAATRDAAAAAFRKAHPKGLDVAYGPAERQKMDIYPAADPAAPCLVFIHGGYWQKNSREVFAHYAAGLLAHSWSVVMPGHTLAPEARLTDIVAEIGSALDFLAMKGPAHGVAGPLVVGGWSAGALLAVQHLHHPAVRAGLAISGIYELGPLRDTFLNDALKLDSAEIAAFSPLRQAPCQKPLLVSYGALELPALVHESRTLSAHRTTARAPGRLLPIAQADHFSILEELRRADGQITRALCALLPAGAA